jgi:2'-5' RNA ligase
VGEWFTSFDDAWSSFLARDEPLESFWEEFPDDPAAVLDAWLVIPPPDVKRQALRLQAVLEDVAELRVVPHHFLHLSLTGTNAVEVDALLERPPFDVKSERMTCFHCAIVAEVHSETLADIDAPETFLPHVSIAYVERPLDPSVVRDLLVPLRDVGIGSFQVDELVRVLVPASKTTILQPWTVVERVSLRR